MNRKAVKRTRWNPWIIVLAAVASVIVFAPASFAAQGEYGAVIDCEYIPADNAFHYYEESADGGYYDVFSSVTGAPDKLRVVYDDITVDCPVYGNGDCETPWGDEIQVWTEDNQGSYSWDDPKADKRVYVHVEIFSGSKSAFRKVLMMKATPQPSPVESAVYTQAKGVPVMVNGFSNYPGDVLLSEKARQRGDSIAVKFKKETAPIEYFCTRDGWIAEDGRILPEQCLRFFCEEEPAPVVELKKGSSADNGFEYETGRHTVKGSYIGAEMEYYFDVEEDPVKSVEFQFPSSPIKLCVPEDYAVKKSDPYTFYVEEMIRNHKLFPEGYGLTVSFRDGTVRTFAYDQSKGEFLDGDQKLPYAEAFGVALKNPDTFKEGVRIQYGKHFETVEIDLRTGHKINGVKAEEPTYFEKGNKEYFTCSECDRFFNDEKGEKEIIKNSWVIPKLEPEGWERDDGAITYDASGDTKIKDTAKGTVAAVTEIPKEAEDSMIAAISSSADQNSTILLNAKVGEGTDQVNSATVQIPANVVRAAEKAGASFGVDTILGKIELNNEAVGGVVSGNSSTKNGLLRGSGSGVVELSITEDSRTKWNVKTTIGIAVDGTKITEPGGETKITVAEPAGTVKDDITESYYINSDGTEEKLQTVRAMGMVTTVTKKMGSYRISTRRNLKNAKITGIASSYTYKGSAHKPKFGVKFKDGTTVYAKYYSVSWSKNKGVGTAKVTVNGKGAYCGSKTKSFYINPKKAGKPRVKVGKNKITITMRSKVSATGGSRYEVLYKRAGAVKWKIAARTSKKQVTISKLKKGKKYLVKVRAYKGSRKGKYSSSTKSRAVK